MGGISIAFVKGYWLNRDLENVRVSQMQRQIIQNCPDIQNVEVVEYFPLINYQIKICTHGGNSISIARVRQNLSFTKSSFIESIDNIHFICYECIYSRLNTELYGGLPVKYVNEIYEGRLVSILDMLLAFEWLSKFVNSLPFDDFSSPSDSFVFGFDKEGIPNGRKCAGYFEMEKGKNRIYLLKRKK